MCSYYCTKIAQAKQPRSNCVATDLGQINDALHGLEELIEFRHEPRMCSSHCLRFWRLTKRIKIHVSCCNWDLL